MIRELRYSIIHNNRWYKNCKSVRKRGGLICKVCPFRRLIEAEEKMSKPSGKAKPSNYPYGSTGGTEMVAKNGKMSSRQQKEWAATARTKYVAREIRRAGNKKSKD